MAKQEYKRRLKAWKVHGFLKSKDELTPLARDKLRSLSQLELAAAARNPHHSEIGRQAALKLLAARGGDLSMADIIVPGFVKYDTLENLQKRFFGWSREFRRWTGVVSLLSFVSVFAAVIWAVEMEDDVLADGVKAGLFTRYDVIISERSLTPEELALAPEGAKETFENRTDLRDVLLYQARETPAGRKHAFVEQLGMVIVGVGVVFFILWLASTMFRSQPARILLLRKFHDKKVTKALSRVISDQLRPFGHIATLADKYIRRSKLSWISNSIPTNFVHAGFIAVWLPVRIVLRQFNRTKYGPVWVGSTRNFKHLAKRFRDRIALNLEVAWTSKEAFMMRSHDLWWQEIIYMVMRSADVIVVDISDVQKGTRWELERLTETGLWKKAVFIANDSRAEQAKHFIAEYDWSADVPVYFYDNLGEFASEMKKAFRLEMLTKIQTSAATYSNVKLVKGGAGSVLVS